MHDRSMAVLLVALALAGGAGAAPDPLEGKWLGTIGSPKERIEVGLEFKRGADGKLVLLLTQPISSYFGVDPGGELQRQGNSVKHPNLALDLTLIGERLEGTFPGPNSAATLRRTRRLPQAPVLPQVPAGPGPRWQVRLGGQIYASPVVAEGRAYIGSTGGVFNTVNVEDGSFAWTFAARCPIHGAAQVAADAVYFACDSQLFKLALADGRELWRYPLGAGSGRILPHPAVFDWDWQGPAPVLADGVVYIGDGDGRLHAVDAASGLARWRFQSGGRIRNGAALDGERVLFGSADHRVYALDRASGRELWRYDTGGEVDAVPVLHAGKVLLGSRGASLHSVQADSGAPDWRLYFWGSWVESTPVVVDGTLYIGASDLRRVSAIDPADGRVLWRTDLHGWTWGTPLVLGERIYAGAAGGTPYFIPHAASFNVLDRRSGRLLQRWPLPAGDGHQWGIAGSPALAGNKVLVATIGGALLAFPVAD